VSQRGGFRLPGDERNVANGLLAIRASAEKTSPHGPAAFAVRTGALPMPCRSTRLDEPLVSSRVFSVAGRFYGEKLVRQHDHAENMRVSITFRDTAGRVWRRDEFGTLKLIAIQCVDRAGDSTVVTIDETVVP
jgi:hypothetical protein